MTVANSKKQPVMTDRPYRMKYFKIDGIKPLQTGQFETNLGFEFTQGEFWNYKLIGAKGTKD